MKSKTSLIVVVILIKVNAHKKWTKGNLEE